MLPRGLLLLRIAAGEHCSPPASSALPDCYIYFQQFSKTVHFLFIFSGYTVSVLRKGAGTRNENVTPSFFIHTPLFF